jgi:phospholipid/cholesterol/gamma-HCH transport system ATP-binding protein
MIEVKDLQLNLAGQEILKRISFRLEDGQNLVIIGRSGSGKTILIKTLMGFFKPEGGQVLVDGHDVYGEDPQVDSSLRHDFAMVFQNAALLDSYTVFQNVALPLYERGEMQYEEIMGRVQKCLTMVGLEDSMGKRPAELSGGMRKRVGIARALVYEPNYIVFDEPVSGLDPITSSEILYYLSQIIGSVKATTITITHDVRNLSDLGDRVLFLENGEALYYGPHDQLAQSGNPLILEFLGLNTHP